MGHHVDDFQEYMNTLGNVPSAIHAMSEVDEEWLSIHTRLRKLVLAPRPDGLPLSTQELVLVALDIAAGNEHGAINHLNAARRAGATKDQLRDIMLCLYLVFGVSKWGLTGHHVWNAWDESETVS